MVGGRGAGGGGGWIISSHRLIIEKKKKNFFSETLCGGGGRGRGGSSFSLYFCIENFKNLLVRIHWTNFNIIYQKYRTIMFLLIIEFIQKF